MYACCGLLGNAMNMIEHVSIFLMHDLSEIAAVIEGLVLMEGTYWGTMTEPCQKEMDEVWNASPKFNLKGSTVSGGYM